MTTATSPPADAPTAQLLDVRAVALLLDCSTRHVYRLSDAGRMPAPVRLGALIRWRRTDLDAWIAGGCRPCRPAGRGSGNQATRGRTVPRGTRQGPDSAFDSRPRLPDSPAAGQQPGRGRA